MIALQMLPHEVAVRELIAYDLDLDPYRAANVSDVALTAAQASAHSAIASQTIAALESALCPQQTATTQHLIAAHSDMHRHSFEQLFSGMAWTLGIVDLRRLLAFQRRLILDPQQPLSVPTADDWPALFDLAFATPRTASCALTASGTTVEIVSSNPDLTIHIDSAAETLHQALQVHPGSQYFEVAEYRDRWFLRDGYHRAFALLQAGICMVPAVILRARSIAELGATQPHFFSESDLFSARPPRVTDFLDETLTLAYRRPRLMKSIRITINEMLLPQNAVF